MVPTSDYNNLVNYYKGAITENALLNKAGRLAAEKQLVLTNKKIPKDLTLAIARGKGRKLNKLTRRIRTGSKKSGGPLADEDDEDAMLYAPMENTLKKFLKQTKRPAIPIPPHPPPVLVIARQPPLTPSMKKTPKLTKLN